MLNKTDPKKEACAKAAMIMAIIRVVILPEIPQISCREYTHQKNKRWFILISAK
jgi:hypothetical protein